MCIRQRYHSLTKTSAQEIPFCAYDDDFIWGLDQESQSGPFVVQALHGPVLWSLHLHSSLPSQSGKRLNCGLLRGIILSPQPVLTLLPTDYLHNVYYV
jgi:hypothetical protein